jgi:uncharacterized repeat protein (TIGR03803 family)
MKTIIGSIGVVCLVGVSLALAQTPAQPPARYLNLLSSVGGIDKYPIYGVEAGLLAEGADGSLYTTSKHGGTNGCGSVIKFTLSGQFTVLSHFDGSNGSQPFGGLTRGRDGNLYGTTFAGGTNKVGTVFMISPTGGPPSILWHFQNRTLNGTNYTHQQKWDAAGGYPYTAPVLAKDGNLYGVTGYANNQKYGVLYRIGTGGGYRAIYYFDGTSGNSPATLIAGGDGNLYGTTHSGKTAGNQWGTIFKATTAGSVSTLHEFGLKPGILPTTLIYGSDGNLYGTTVKGLTGAGGGRGILYKLPLDGTGKFQVLHQFVGGADGTGPTGLVEGDDGYLYGVSQGGPGMGSVFYRIGKDGQGFKVLCHFASATTGESPQGNLMRHSNRNFYGTANSGGAFNRGTMYVANPCPLPPRPGQPVFKGGSKAYEDEAMLVRTNVNASQVKPDGTTNVFDDGITICVKCTDDPHIVQFISRYYVLTNGVPDGGCYPVLDQSKQTNCWAYTTSTNNPNWRIDSLGKPNPYYESGGSYRTDCDSMTTFDEPRLNPDSRYQFRQVSAKVFVICHSNIVSEFTWRREAKDGKPPTYTVLPPTSPDQIEYAKFRNVSDRDGYAPWP